MSDNQNEVVTALQGLIEKSIKANTEFLQESGKIFTGLLTKKLNTKDMVELNNQVLSDAVSSYIKMNIKHTENLMDFGVNVSRSIVSFIDKVNKTTENTVSASDLNNDNKSATHNSNNNQINLSVKQGEQIATSFYLNSHNAFSQTGKFVYNDLVDIITGKKASLTLSISPKEFTLDSGKSIKVDISIGAGNDVTPGKYKTTVSLDGMDTQEFDIVIEVLENKPSNKKADVSAHPVKEPHLKKTAKRKNKKDKP